jgi:ribonuclease BN (tRNA processing enzyme)
MNLERQILAGVISALIAPKLASLGLHLTADQAAQLAAAGAVAGATLYHLAAEYLRAKYPRLSQLSPIDAHLTPEQRAELVQLVGSFLKSKLPSQPPKEQSK